MKRQLLASVIAGLGVVGSAHAVHVNPDGLGQVLLYPYYSVQDGNDTYVHVVNTTTAAKAVKVRFLEGKNSQEVLDFNLYLSAKDEWTAVITRTETGAQLATTDTSCTAPAIPAGGIAFRNFEYKGDGGGDTLERTREGYLEIIEMGDLDDVAPAIAAAATHTAAGVPADCAAVRAHASTASGTLPASGGLYGFNTLINVEAGLSSTVDAVALDDFWLNNEGTYTTTGSLSPSLEDGTQSADILDGNQVINAVFGQRIDAVSAVLSRTNVMNDYVVGLDFNALTDWVVTFPTKRFYVNGDLAPRDPFTQKWVGTSCDSISITYYDREEQREVGEDDFSPQPVAEGATLCNEVNTISIVANGEEGGLLGAEFTAAQIELAAGFNAGWMDIGFNSDAAQDGLVSLNGVTVTGLPVIGFSAMSFTNNTLVVDGVNVLSNYGGTSVHKGLRDITVVAPQ
ncbi:hypothetical protein [Thauera chlorobenzoica]|uniref:hypothetical protein n=1 Tax=Thauera chlorobenzoica TaxID=96773 RepID=UPI0008A00DD8|nr:hypothetical protein [Thauera chlorobenzoica]SEF66657.1 hypothetical protein SAMN05216242_103210 [Thauera chlorobenzoica]